MAEKHRVSYKTLIFEHDAIEQASCELLDAVEESGTSVEALRAMLDRLAALVEGHVRREEDILHNLGQDQLDGPWARKWKEAASAFDQLCADWTTFLHQWTAFEITRRRQEFVVASRSILTRLNERVRFETASFYALALQSGAITLR